MLLPICYLELVLSRHSGILIVNKIFPRKCEWWVSTYTPCVCVCSESQLFYSTRCFRSGAAATESTSVARLCMASGACFSFARDRRDGCFLRRAYIARMRPGFVLTPHFAPFLFLVRQIAARAPCCLLKGQVDESCWYHLQTQSDSERQKDQDRIAASLCER